MTDLDHDHAGPDSACPACKPLADVLRDRMKWPSMHWGELHPDAYPSLARAVHEAGYGLLAPLIDRAERNEAERDEAKRRALSAANERDEQRRMKEGNITAQETDSDEAEAAWIWWLDDDVKRAVPQLANVSVRSAFLAGFRAARLAGKDDENGRQTCRRCDEPPEPEPEERFCPDCQHYERVCSSDHCIECGAAT